MIFTESSSIVQSWVRQIQNGVRDREEIPNIGNLQSVVLTILNK
jgi:hypothetical protein